MANYYTLSSFVIPCPQDVATTAIDAYKQINDQTVHLQETFAAVRNGEKEISDLSPADRFMYLVVSNHDEQGAGPEIYQYLSLSFECQQIEGGLHISHDETIDVEAAATFVQYLLVCWDLDFPVLIEYAQICSKARPDAFAGGAILVTQSNISHSSPITSLGHDFHAAVDRVSHSKCAYNETHDGIPNIFDFVLRYPNGTSAEDACERIAKERFPDNGNVSACLTAPVPIDASEYEILRKYVATFVSDGKNITTLPL